MARILVVDDEKAITDSIEFALKKAGFQADVLHDGLSAWNYLQHHSPALIVLDIMMPRMDGLELCRRMRAGELQIPILFLSSRDDEIDRILGLEMGGDDYLSKPFSMRELIARIRAILKRTESKSVQSDGPGADGSKLVYGPITLHPDQAMVSISGATGRLTLTELRILTALMEYPDRILSRDQLMFAAFPDDSFPNSRAADSHIKRLRRKFGDLCPGFDPIETVYGMGYRLRGATDGGRHPFCRKHTGGRRNPL